MPTSGRGKLGLTAIALAIFAFAAIAHAGNLGHNPANSPKLLNEPIESLSYDSARKCKGGDRPGARALAEWIADHTRGELWGIYRCEKWGKDSASVHAEGRAIDYRSMPASRRRSAPRCT